MLDTPPMPGTKVQIKAGHFKGEIAEVVAVRTDKLNYIIDVKLNGRLLYYFLDQLTLPQKPKQTKR